MSASKNSLLKNCVLCNCTCDIFYQFKERLYFQCTNCKGILMDKNLWPNQADEKLRYEEHINDVEDKRYQKFVSPISSNILKQFKPTDKGLDFGAGTGPVISKLLLDKGYYIKQYDPFFHDYPRLLEERYDYIACCEVIEHFHDPYTEFNLLKKLLSPNGKLYIMTDLYDESIDFHKWYYKNDQTHVFIYHKTTITWLRSEFQFKEVNIDKRLITFSN